MSSRSRTNRQHYPVLFAMLEQERRCSFSISRMWSPLLVLQMDDVSIVDLDAPLGIDNALAPVSSLAALAKAFRFRLL